jgi:hypothetical protein
MVQLVTPQAIGGVGFNAFLMNRQPRRLNMAKAKKNAATPATPSMPPAPAAAPTAAAQPAARSVVKGSGTAKSAAPASREITQDMIARRAFEIYAGRGYAAGDQDADWHEAERQLRAGL